jgi:hypothetical protein
LDDVTHYADHLDILLVAPDSSTSVVMSDVCDTDVVNQDWIFSQAALVPMTTPCAGLLYKPTKAPFNNNYWPGAPEGPYEANFDRLVGGNPNGDWKLYVFDDWQGGVPGQIAGGWTLTIETAVPDAEVPAVSYAAGPANLYPLTRDVSGREGVISDVDVSLSGIFHSRPDDLELLLVGPKGERVVLMSDACGTTPVKYANWGWNDESLDSMSDEGTCPTNRAYSPTDLEAQDNMDPPAPPRPYATALSAFDFTEPNGEWRLYAYDDKATAAGFFLQRFALNMTTRPRATVGFAEGAVDVTEGDRRELTITRSAEGVGLGPASVVVTSSPVSAAQDDFEPVAQRVEFARGQKDAKVSVSAIADARAEQPETLALKIAEPSGDAAPANPATAVVTIRDRATDGGGGTPGGGTGGSVLDTVAPTLSGLAVAPRRFPVARRRGSGGTTIGFALSEAATVRFRLERAVAPRRFVRAGRLRRSGRAGTNRFRFSGRIGTRALRPGRYRLRARAVDSAGNRSAWRTRRFRIVR